MMYLRALLIMAAFVAQVGAAQTAEQQLSFAENLHDSGDDAFAMLELKRFVFHHPEHAKVPEAFIRLAMLYVSHRGDVGGARSILKAVAERYPGTAAAQEAKERLDFVEVNSDFEGKPLTLWLAAESMEKQQAFPQAVANYDALLSKYPAARLADNSLLRKGTILRDKLGQADKALAALLTLKKQFPKSALLVSSEYEVAVTLAAIKGREADAATAFRNFVAAHPKDAHAAQAQSQADELDRRSFQIKKQFDAGFVRQYVVKATRPEKGCLTIDVELAVGLSQREVQATMEDALLKESPKRLSPKDRVALNAYFNYPLTRAGKVDWLPGKEPVYEVTQQTTKSVVRDAFIDILRRR